MKFKKLRIFLDDARSLILGWYFCFCKTSLKEVVFNREWVCISDFSTNIKWREELGEINHNRITNMKLSCEDISGTVVEPGGILSLRRIVGEATPERGYKKGPVIANGQLGFTYGGGLCQASTTLFNAALLANLQILEKHNHSTDIWGEERFIELGRDAIYVFARKDLKFRNRHDCEIALKMDVDEDRRTLNCKVFSKKALPCNVKVEHLVIKELKPSRRNGNIQKRKIREIKGWIILTIRYIEVDGMKKITYRKCEKYKPAIVQDSE